MNLSAENIISVLQVYCKAGLGQSLKKQLDQEQTCLEGQTPFRPAL